MRSGNMKWYLVCMSQNARPYHTRRRMNAKRIHSIFQLDVNFSYYSSRFASRATPLLISACLCTKDRVKMLKWRELLGRSSIKNDTFRKIYAKRMLLIVFAQNFKYIEYVCVCVWVCWHSWLRSFSARHVIQQATFYVCIRKMNMKLTQ